MSDIAKVVIGISFIFLMTTLGGMMVFLFKKETSQKLNKFISGFSSGIMIAASIWSLLLPAIDSSQNFGKLSFLPATIGFLIGGVVLTVIDVICRRVNHGKMNSYNKLFFALTLHNIPEGLAVGVAFGAAFASANSSAMLLALSLALGMGIQNFPEGMAIALPVKQHTGSKFKGFLMATLSGAVEPVGAVIGFFLSASVSLVLPWVLAFAAGAMIFVVVGEMFLQNQTEEANGFYVWGTMIGFALMMALDVGLA